jgi:hypothetical protein
MQNDERDSPELPSIKMRRRYSKLRLLECKTTPCYLNGRLHDRETDSLKLMDVWAWEVSVTQINFNGKGLWDASLTMTATF